MSNMKPTILVTSGAGNTGRPDSDIGLFDRHGKAYITGMSTWIAQPRGEV